MTTTLHNLPKLDELTGNNRAWADRWLTDVETHDLPDGFRVGDRVIVNNGRAFEDEGEVIGAHTAADGSRWLMLWGLKAAVTAFPCWEAKPSEVRRP